MVNRNSFIYFTLTFPVLVDCFGSCSRPNHIILSYCPTSCTVSVIKRCQFPPSSSQGYIPLLAKCFSMYTDVVIYAGSPYLLVPSFPMTTELLYVAQSVQIALFFISENAIMVIEGPSMFYFSKETLLDCHRTHFDVICSDLISCRRICFS